MTLRELINCLKSYDKGQRNSEVVEYRIEIRGDRQNISLSNDFTKIFGVQFIVSDPPPAKRTRKVKEAK